MTIAPSSRAKFTVPMLAARKATQEKIAMITAYDATFTCIVDAAGVDIILVGDSVATVFQGERTTLPVTLWEMEYHTRLVAKTRPRAMIVGDLPFGSYQVSPELAVTHSVALIKAGAECVKLEGGIHMASAIQAITRADIPVMGHIGLTPQSYHRMGGNKVQGRTDGIDPGGRDRLLEDAYAVEQAGACALVIEGIPGSLAREITDKVSIPTIGIGAGVYCDGQVLVLHDALGLSERSFTFAKAYAQLRTTSIEAITQYVDEVRTGTWPDDSHTYR